MQVEKWYLDCVAADGGGFIGYAARLRWGPVAARCSETLLWGRLAAPAASGLRWGGRLPETGPDGLHWDNPAVDARGRWRALAPAFAPQVLHEEAAGRIEWHCCCPRADAAVQVAGTRLEGLGYAERLVLTLPPARLPFREQQWGRFLGAEQDCVWIVWAAPTPRAWVFHQGQPVVAAIEAGPRLRWPDHELHLEPGTALRSGPLEATILRRAPLLRRLLPASFGRVVETKWCSPGVLTDARGQACAGWAIHEVAFFP